MNLEEKVEAVNTIAAREARADGIHWGFSPMLDIARDPRWGRVAEGFGEDPCLVGKLAATAVKGFQGNEQDAIPQQFAGDRIVACAKHFVGYGAAEGGRDYNGTEIKQGGNNRRPVLHPGSRFECGPAGGPETFLDLIPEIREKPQSILFSPASQFTKNNCIIINDGVTNRLFLNSTA